MAGLSEYDDAVASLFNEATWALMTSREPLIKEFQLVYVDHLPGHNSQANGTHGMSFQGITVKTIAGASLEDLINTNVDCFSAFVAEAAVQRLDSIMPWIIHNIRAASDLAESGVSSSNKPISYDLILDMLEKMSVHVNDEGVPEGLRLLIPPQLIEQVRQLPPMTEEQQKRFTEIMRKKKAENDAKKRVRKLDKGD